MRSQLASHWAQAQRALSLDRPEEARASLQAILQLDSLHADAHLLLSALAYTSGQLRQAAHHAMLACSRPFADANTLANAVSALLRTGEVAQAEHTLRSDPAVRSCQDGRVLLRLANAEQMVGNHVRALNLIDRAIASGFDNPDVRFLRSVQLVFNGHIEEAVPELKKCLAGSIGYGRASVTLARLRKQTADDNNLDAIRRRLQTVVRGSEDEAALEFARYKELEDIGNHADAWQALERGNGIMHRRLKPDSGRDAALVDALIEKTSYLPEFTQAPASGPQPIFIIGMPRSGTTLLDRILGNHSQAVSAGELGDFSRQLRWMADHVTDAWMDAHLLSLLSAMPLYEVGQRYLTQTRWRAEGHDRYVDKLPANYLLAGLIACALPHARILHLVRDPMDVCFSNYRAFFGGGYGYSYDLGSLAQHYLDYQRLMAHWHRVVPHRILDVPYARLTHDSEAMAREVFDFCGLAFEPGCLDLARNKAPIATLSAMQVRGEIRQTAFEEWRPYARQLSQLRSKITPQSI